MKVVLSGMRPTGLLHLGNLVGAIYNWKVLQDMEDHKSLFMVADYHALTTEYINTENIRSYIKEMVTDWIACGIDYNKSMIFCQSQVPEHAQLHLILSVITPLPLLLQENPTYKEQIRELKNKNLNTYGFLGYPVLQSADILLYKAELVPVGIDQLPHLEITRKLTRKFNSLYGEIFPIPQPYVNEKTSKLPGPDARKMSKSYQNCIYLSDKAEVIKKKVRQMITDPQKIKKSDKGEPLKCRVVYQYHKIFNEDGIEEVEEDCRAGRRGCVACKEELAHKLIKFLEPISERRDELIKEDIVDDIISTGSKKAHELAKTTLEEVMNAIFK